MGLFASRPEEPFEWAGLPSEPLAPESEAEKLGDAPASPGLLDVGGGPSISIRLSPAPADADDAV